MSARRIKFPIKAEFLKCYRAFKDFLFIRRGRQISDKKKYFLENDTYRDEIYGLGEIKI
jgi:hypothetical protein